MKVGVIGVVRSDEETAEKTQDAGTSDAILVAQRNCLGGVNILGVCICG